MSPTICENLPTVLSSTARGLSVCLSVCLPLLYWQSHKVPQKLILKSYLNKSTSPSGKKKGEESYEVLRIKSNEQQTYAQSRQNKL